MWAGCYCWWKHLKEKVTCWSSVASLLSGKWKASLDVGLAAGSIFLLKCLEGCRWLLWLLVLLGTSTVVLLGIRCILPFSCRRRIEEMVCICSFLRSHLASPAKNWWSGTINPSPTFDSLEIGGHKDKGNKESTIDAKLGTGSINFILSLQNRLQHPFHLNY